MLGPVIIHDQCVGQHLRTVPGFTKFGIKTFIKHRLDGSDGSFSVWCVGSGDKVLYLIVAVVGHGLF